VEHLNRLDWEPSGRCSTLRPGFSNRFTIAKPREVKLLFKLKLLPISYRIAVGPQQGRKAFMIRTIRPLDRPDPGLERVAKANGFSLHAGVSCEGHERNKRERLCRYIARPAVAIPRLSLSSTGKVVYSLKTPYRESLPHERSECFGHGTTQVAFDRGGHPPITAGVGWSHQPGVAKASSPSPTQNSAHLPNVMRQ